MKFDVFKKKKLLLRFYEYFSKILMHLYYYFALVAFGYDAV